jgi:hypothetical protein
VLFIYAPCQYDLTMTSCIHPVLLSWRISSLIVPMIDSVWKFLSYWGMLSLTLEFGKVPLHFEHPLQLLDQEDWVMKCNTSIVKKHTLILQGAMSPTHGRKSYIGDQKVFLLLTILISSFHHDQYILHCFLCSPFFHIARDEISLRGRAVTPRVTKTLITLVRFLTKL